MGIKISKNFDSKNVLKDTFLNMAKKLGKTISLALQLMFGYENDGEN